MNGYRYLWECVAAIQARLGRLRLTIHRGAHPRPVTEGIPFLGFVIYPDRRRLKRRNAVNARRRLRERVAEYATGETTFDELTASIRGWVNHARYANTVGLRKALLRSVTVPPTISRYEG